MEILNKISRILGWPLVVLLWVYQHTLSPDHGPLKVFFPYGYCKFHPSCSMYAMQVLQQDGLIGLPKIINRLFRCNPRSLGGIDYPYTHGPLL